MCKITKLLRNFNLKHITYNTCIYIYTYIRFLEKSWQESNYAPRNFIKSLTSFLFVLYLKITAFVSWNSFPDCLVAGNVWSAANDFGCMCTRLLKLILFIKYVNFQQSLRWICKVLIEALLLFSFFMLNNFINLIWAEACWDFLSILLCPTTIPKHLNLSNPCRIV